MIILAIFLLIGCKKSDNEKDVNYYDLITINDWATIDFKTNYTIQVPNGFVGPGMVIFEGNTFFKSSVDNKIQLSAGYCNGLFCSDFGDSIKNPIPASIHVMNNYSKMVTLSQIEYFRQNTETTGIFYYSQDDTANGRLYWKDNGTLKDALEVEFNKSNLDTVFKIIGSIKRK